MSVSLSCVSTGSHGNCYFIRDGDSYLMLDCGDHIPWRSVLSGCDFQISHVDAALITHKHSDHCGNIKELLFYGVTIYTNRETADFINETYATKLHIPYNEKSIVVRPRKRLVIIPKMWEVIAWYVPHTGNNGQDCPCYAYYIKTPSGHSLAYITDFLYSPLTFKSLNVETILIACNHDDELDEVNEQKFRHIVSGHSSLSTVKELIRVNQTDCLRNVILCHLSAENATPEKMVSEIQEVTGDHVTVSIAQKGMKYFLQGAHK